MDFGGEDVKPGRQCFQKATVKRHSCTHRSAGGVQRGRACLADGLQGLGEFGVLGLVHARSVLEPDPRLSFVRLLPGLEQHHARPMAPPRRRPVAPITCALRP